VSHIVKGEALPSELSEMPESRDVYKDGQMEHAEPHNLRRRIGAFALAAVVGVAAVGTYEAVSTVRHLTQDITHSAEGLINRIFPNFFPYSASQIVENNAVKTLKLAHKSIFSEAQATAGGQLKDTYITPNIPFIGRSTFGPLGSTETVSVQSELQGVVDETGVTYGAVKNSSGNYELAAYVPVSDLFIQAANDKITSVDFQVGTLAKLNPEKQALEATALENYLFGELPNSCNSVASYVAVPGIENVLTVDMKGMLSAANSIPGISASDFTRINYMVRNGIVVRLTEKDSAGKTILLSDQTGNLSLPINGPSVMTKAELASASGISPANLTVSNSNECVYDPAAINSIINANQKAK